MTLLIGLALRSSIVLLLGLLLRACLSRHSAALRHRVLAGALLGATLVVPLSVLLPSWTVRLPAPAAGERAVGTATGHLSPANSPDRVRRSDSSPAALSPIVATWVAGAGLGIAALLAGVWRIRRVTAGAERITAPLWIATLGEVATGLGLRRRVTVWRTDSADLLATWGVLRPQILVPHDAPDWAADRIRVVLAHELAHIRRHDWIVQTAAEALRAISWFNPLAWMVCARLRRDSEQACDDEVLGIGVDGRDYATHLVALARQCRRPVSPWASAIPMAHPSTLERRIAAMLNPHLRRRPPSRVTLAGLAGVLLAVTLPVAAVRAAQNGPAPLSGTVYDVSGGVLPGVEVALMDAEKKATTVQTNAEGRFEFPLVAAGNYVLDVSLPGFRTLRHEFALREMRDWDRAVTLQVGDLRETIMVRGSRVGSPTPPPAAGPQPLRVGGNVRAPRKIRDVKPAYPASMREAGLAGVVPLEAMIGRDGSVASVRVLSAQVHPDFAVAAVDAVRQWRFTPTLLNGQPVEVVMTVSVTFEIENQD